MIFQNFDLYFDLLVKIYRSKWVTFLHIIFDLALFWWSRVRSIFQPCWGHSPRFDFYNWPPSRIRRWHQGRCWLHRRRTGGRGLRWCTAVERRPRDAARTADRGRTTRPPESDPNQRRAGTCYRPVGNLAKKEPQYLFHTTLNKMCRKPLGLRLCDWLCAYIK